MSNQTELYSNVLFKMSNKKIIDNEVFVDLELHDKTKSNFKIVGPGKKGLTGVDFETIDEEIKILAKNKYNLANIVINDDEYEEIEDKIETEKEIKKMNRKEERKLRETLEEEFISKKKEILEKNYYENIWNGNIVLQANAIFLNEKGGLLQIPGHPEFKARNTHLIKDIGFLIELSAKEWGKNEYLTFEEINQGDGKNINLIAKIHHFSGVEGIKDLFQINDYLIDKIFDQNIKKTESKIDPELYNLLKIIDSENKNTDVLNIEKFIEKYSKCEDKELEFIKNEEKEKIVKISQEDIDLLRNSYKNILNSIIINENENEFIKIPDNLSIYSNIYFMPTKKLDFINSIKTELESDKSPLIAMENKDKQKYRENLDKLKFKNIICRVKMAQEKTEDGIYQLHSVYQYKNKKGTQRIISHSTSPTSGTIPNIISPVEGKGRSFILSLESLREIKELAN